MDSHRDPIQAMIDAPLGWLPASWFGPGGLAGTNGELARSDAPDGRLFVTLTPLEALRRQVHLIEISGRDARRAAWYAAWPERWTETAAALERTADRVERFRLLRGYLEAVAWVPLVRWAPAVRDEEGVILDNGPRPREERERPCVTIPRRADWIRAADWRLEELIEAARGQVEPTTPAEWRVVLGFDQKRREGSGVSSPRLDPVLRRLLIDADRDRRKRQREKRQRRRA